MRPVPILQQIPVCYVQFNSFELKFMQISILSHVYSQAAKHLCLITSERNQYQYQ